MPTEPTELSIGGVRNGMRIVRINRSNPTETRCGTIVQSEAFANEDDTLVILVRWDGSAYETQESIGENMGLTSQRKGGISPYKTVLERAFKLWKAQCALAEARNAGLLNTSPTGPID